MEQSLASTPQEKNNVANHEWSHFLLSKKDVVYPIL